MNESGSLDGYFIFDRSKIFVFEKKLEISEHITNGMLLRSVYFNKTSVVMVDQGWCLIDFLIGNRSHLYKIHCSSVQNLLIFF